MPIEDEIKIDKNKTKNSGHASHIAETEKKAEVGAFN